MAKSNKPRAGLQKKISSVFKGASVPRANRGGEPVRAKAPDRKAVSPNAKPDDSRSLYAPEIDGAPQPQVLASRTKGQGNAAVESPISTDVESSPNTSIEKHAPSEESQSTLTLEPEVMYTPADPAVPKTVRKPASEKSDPVDEPASKPTPKKAARSAPRASTKRSPEPSSLMKKLAQLQESEDAGVGSASVSAGPVHVKNRADQTASDRARKPEPPAAADGRKDQSPLAKKLAQAEEAANDSPAKRAAATPVSKPAGRHNLQSTKPRDVRQPQAPPAATAPVRNPLADQIADGLYEVGFLQQIREKLIPSEGGSAKDKVMLMLVPVLAIVMVFVFRQVLHKSPGKTQAADKTDKTVVAAVKPGDEIEWTIPDPLPAMTRNPLKLPEPDEPENPDQTGNENPDQGETTDQTQIRELQIRDIVYSDEKATAIVGNKIVRPGSRINGITIVKINRDSVELERNGETWVQKVRD